MTSTTVRALSQSDVFASLDEAELVRLASACGQRTYGRGQLVFLRGDPGDCMYVVAAGAVAVSLSSVGGRDVLLAVLGPNQSFGELALVDDGPRVAPVTARTRSVLVVVPRRAAAEVMARQPAVVTALLVSLAALVRRLDEQACDAALLDLPRRVEKHLAGLAGGRATAAEGARRLGAGRRVADPGRPGPPDRRVPPAGQPRPDEPGGSRGDHPPRSPHRRHPPAAALHRRLDAVTANCGGHWTHS